MDTASPHIAYLSLGSNLGDRRKNLDDCLGMLEKRIGPVSNASGIYETEPWGYDSAHAFYNMCVEVHTHLPPVKLLQELLAIEAMLGRERRIEEGYNDRLIDLDLLFYNREILNTEGLIVPHPRMIERRFVLQPLEEICPEYMHPVHKTSVSALLKNCTDRGLVVPIG